VTIRTTSSVAEVEAVEAIEAVLTLRQAAVQLCGKSAGGQRIE